jgi:hypothetical protein
MRLRPATPLSVVLFAAFALLLVSVLSTPIINGIPLGKFKDFSFGVFGYCELDKCSSISIGYDPSASPYLREMMGACKARLQGEKMVC